jgi:hypothetical protein
MATKSRPKAAVRAAKGKGGRRPPVRVKRASDFPILPVAVGAILLALVVVVIVFIVQNNKSSSPGLDPSAAGVPCDSLEHTQIHYHAALQIIYQGNVVNLPDNLGIQLDPTGTSVKCYYWLHVHAQNKNVIHIESPANDTFTLGQFIAVWKQWAKVNDQVVPALDATHVATYTLLPGQTLYTYIDLQDGKGPTLFTGDPNKIPLKAHEVISLEIAPTGNPTRPPSFTFTSGL